jgi:hypothetical protein
MDGFTEMRPCRDIPCASCGHQQPGGYSWALHPAGERAEQLGVASDALVCYGCRDCDAIRPTMSQATRREIVALWGAFKDRVSRANRKLEVKDAALLKPACDIPSPAFRVTFKNTPEATNRAAKLYKLGVPGDAVTFLC